MVFISTFRVHSFVITYVLERFSDCEKIFSIWNRSISGKSKSIYIISFAIAIATAVCRYHCQNIQAAIHSNTLDQNIFGNKINVLRAKTVRGELLSKWTVIAFFCSTMDEKAKKKKYIFRLVRLHSSLRVLSWSGFFDNIPLLLDIRKVNVRKYGRNNNIICVYVNCKTFEVISVFSVIVSYIDLKYVKMCRGVDDNSY